MSRRIHWRAILKGTGLAAAFGLVGLGIICLPQVREWLLPAVGEADLDPPPPASAQLIAGRLDALRLPAAVASELGIQTSEVQPAAEAMSLELSGTLILDPDRLSHVHARFAGEVVEFGSTSGPATAATAKSPPPKGGTTGATPDASPRGVDFGDPVRKGQLLAVLWSRELGEKKSELVDVLSQLRADERTLAQLTAAAGAGAIPDRTVRDAERKVEAGRIAEARVVRTLQTWRVQDNEIGALRTEASRLAQSKATERTREDLVQQWARLEVRSPKDGVILEKNIALNDLVDTSLDLFKIADLSRLRVMAQAYEEDLPLLDAIPEGRRNWVIHVGANPAAEGRSGNFDLIGRIIDPNQHTAMVMGWVDNADGRLRVGQFVTATVSLSARKDEVAVPATAVVEQGAQQILFVQSEQGDAAYFERQVALSRRGGGTVFLRGEVTAAERQRGLQPLRAGERVVSSGAVQLISILNDLRSEAAATRR